MIKACDVSYRHPLQPKASPDLLSAINLSVAEGEAVGIVGHNGSGKSTLLKLLASILKPTAGTIMIGDSPLGECLLAYRRQLNYSAGGPQGFYPRLSALDNLVFFSALKGSMLSREEAELLLREVGLAEVATYQKYATFSLGMRQRLHAARLLLTPCSILLIDEPTNGLDRAGVEMMHRLLTERLSSMTKIIISHDDNFLQSVTTKRYALKDGALA